MCSLSVVPRRTDNQLSARYWPRSGTECGASFSTFPYLRRLAERRYPVSYARRAARLLTKVTRRAAAGRPDGAQNHTLKPAIAPNWCFCCLRLRPGSRDRQVGLALTGYSDVERRADDGCRSDRTAEIINKPSSVIARPLFELSLPESLLAAQVVVGQAAARPDPDDVREHHSEANARCDRKIARRTGFATARRSLGTRRCLPVAQRRAHAQVVDDENVEADLGLNVRAVDACSCRSRCWWSSFRFRSTGRRPFRFSCVSLANDSPTSRSADNTKRDWVVANVEPGCCAPARPASRMIPVAVAAAITPRMSYSSARFTGHSRTGTTRRTVARVVCVCAPAKKMGGRVRTISRGFSSAALIHAA